MSIEGCIKAASEPCVKLIEAVQSGIGKLYEPVHIKRIADAKRYEIDAVSEAIRNNYDIPINYNKGEISESNIEWDDFVKRTQSRLAYQELRKQNNIETVIGKAYHLLENTDISVSNENVDQDWINRFFDSIQDISNEQMQEIWAKILAGEVINPNSVSLRTLNVLRNITQKEAKLFVSFLPYFIHCKTNVHDQYDDYFILRDCLDNCDSTYSDIQLLIDAGLMFHNSSVFFGFEIEPNKSEFIYGKNNAICLKNIWNEKIYINISGYGLTEAGKEIYISLNDDKFPDQKFYFDCLKTIKEEINFFYGEVIVDNKILVKLKTE